MINIKPTENRDFDTKMFREINVKLLQFDSHVFTNAAAIPSYLHAYGVNEKFRNGYGTSAYCKCSWFIRKVSNNAYIFFYLS